MADGKTACKGKMFAFGGRLDFARSKWANGKCAHRITNALGGMRHHVIKNDQPRG